MKLERDISEGRQELDRLIEIRESLSELILIVSQRLDVLIVEYMRKVKGHNPGN